MHILPAKASSARPRVVSRRDALRYATALAGLGAASVACGMPTAAAAAPPQLIDFAARQIPAQQIRAAGYSGVVNYVSESRPGSSFGAKPITRPYADSLKAGGLVLVSNYQYGKPGGSAPSDFTRGYAGGIADARTAWQLHTAAGGSQGAPIFFPIDEVARHRGAGRPCPSGPTTRRSRNRPSSPPASRSSWLPSRPTPS